LFVASFPAKVSTSSSNNVASSSCADGVVEDSCRIARIREIVPDTVVSAADVVMAPPAAKEGSDELSEEEEEEGACTIRDIYSVPPSDAPGKSCLRVRFTFKTKKMTFCNKEPVSALPTTIKKKKLKLFSIEQEVADGANLSQLFENMKSRIKFHKQESERHKKNSARSYKADMYKADALKYRKQRDELREFYREQNDSLKKKHAELKEELDAVRDQLQRFGVF
jgi:hypothetical protein